MAGPADAASGWHLLPTSAATAAQSSVSCSGSGNCLSVSAHGAALHYNGTTWTAVSTPAGAAMNGVACPATNDCIVVGSVPKGGSGATSAAAWRWNGSSFTAQAVSNPGSLYNSLNGIRCASTTSCEAVGAHDTSAADYPLAETWNGSSWADQSTTGSPPGTLYSVSCESATKCEAVGEASNATSGGTVLAMALTGTHWVSQATPALPNFYESPDGLFYSYLTSISCYSTGCIAVGHQHYCACSPETAGDYLVAEVWNGTSWKLLVAEGQGDPQAGEPPSSEGWTAVHCVSAANCTAVGYWTDDNEAQPLETLVSAWNGSKWKQVPAPSPGLNSIDQPSGLLGLACTSGGSVCTAVGYQTNTSDQEIALAERS